MNIIEIKKMIEERGTPSEYMLLLEIENLNEQLAQEQAKKRPDHIYFTYDHISKLPIVYYERNNMNKGTMAVRIEDA